MRTDGEFLRTSRVPRDPALRRVTDMSIQPTSVSRPRGVYILSLVVLATGLLLATVVLVLASTTSGSISPQVLGVASAQSQPVEALGADVAESDAREVDRSSDLRSRRLLTWGPDATPPSVDWTKPELNKRYRDPAYRTRIQRVTSAEGTRFDRNTYSRRQAENARGNLFMTYHGEAEYRVYNRRTLKLKRVLDIHPDSEPQWHATHRNLIRHIAGSNASVGDLRLYQTNVRNGRTKVIADLTARVQEVWPEANYLADRAEGTPSADGNHYAWIVFDDSEQQLGIISYDVKADQLLGAIPLKTDGGKLDWVSASVTGSYVAAGYADGTFVYDTDLTNERRLTIKGDHSDLALTADGRDAYVYIDFSSSPDAGWLVSIDLDTLDRTQIFDIYEGGNTSIHISGKGYDKPGWVVASTYNCKEPGSWTCEKVFAVELAEGGRILNLAHTYNCGEDYWTETHAVVNRSFSRVYFNSDGGSCGIDAEVYLLAVPAKRFE